MTIIQNVKIAGCQLNINSIFYFSHHEKIPGNSIKTPSSMAGQNDWVYFGPHTHEIIIVEMQGVFPRCVFEKKRKYAAYS